MYRTCRAPAHTQSNLNITVYGELGKTPLIFQIAKLVVRYILV